MMLTFSRSRSPLLGILTLSTVITVALGSRTAAAQTPPSDLPPLPAPGAQPAPAKAAPAPQAAPQAAPPGYGVPPGLSWMSPNEVPPGYPVPMPGYYPYAMPAPQPQAAAPSAADYRIPPPPPRERRDKSLMIGGIIAVTGGMAAVFTGAFLVSSGAGRIDIFCDSPSFPCAHKNDAPRMTTGVLMMIGGGLVGAAGVPMWMIGSQYVYAPQKDQKDQKDQKKAALVPVVGVGPGSVDVTFKF